jgi:hypothetical protein
MKRSAPLLDRQMNLSLLDAPAPLGAPGNQRELTLALVELLLNAAQEGRETQVNGEEDEPLEANA